MEQIKSFWRKLVTLGKDDRTWFEKLEVEGSLNSLDRGREEQIFDCAKVTIQRGEMEFMYNLIVKSKGLRTRRRKRAYGLEELNFSITTRMRLCSEIVEKRTEHVMILEWKGTDRKTYHLQVKSKKKQLEHVEEFKDGLCKLIHQSKYKAEHSDDLMTGEYLLFCGARRQKELMPNVSETTSFTTTTEEDTSSIFDGLLDSVASKSCYLSPIHAQSISTADCQTNLELSFMEPEPTKKVHKEHIGNVLEMRLEEVKEHVGQQSIVIEEPQSQWQNCFEQQCTFYKFGSENDFLMTDAIVKIDVECEGLDLPRLTAYNCKGELLCKKAIASERDYHFDLYDESFKWSISEGEDRGAYMLKFEDPQALQALDSTLIMIKVSADIRLKEVEDNKQLEEVQVKVEEDTDQPALILITQDEYRISAPAKDIRDLGELQVSNSYLAQSAVVNRVFAHKEDRVEVYKPVSRANRSDLQLICRLPKLRAIHGDHIALKKMLFYNQGKKALLLNRKLDKTMYCYDLEKGKVINELFLDGFNRIADIRRLYPDSQDEDKRDVVIGFNKKALFSYNPLQDDEEDLKGIPCQVYASNPKFTALAVAKGGHFATGSQNGEVRLFKELGKKAMNVLAASKAPLEPIIGLESSADGHWLLGTTERSLFFVPTFVGDKDGYTSSLRRIKPQPTLLALPAATTNDPSPQPSFMPAVISIAEPNGQFHVIAGQGSVLVLWTLDRQMEMVGGPYTIELSEQVLEYQFVFGRVDQAYVTTQSGVEVVTL